MIPFLNPDENEVRCPTCWGIIDNCLRCGGVGKVFVEDLTKEEITDVESSNIQDLSS